MSDATVVVNATLPTAVYPESFSFRFKKDDTGNQRAKVELKAEVASLVGIKNILELPTVAPEGATDEEKKVYAANKAEQDLLLESMYDVYRDVIGDWVGSDPANGQDNFKQESFTWRAIATMPKEDRRSSSIPKEQWDAFAKEYAEVMMAVANRTKDQVAAALLILTKKFNPIKTNKPAIKFMQGQLGLFIDNTKNGEQFSDILTVLVTKAEELLKDKSSEDLVGNLGM